MKRKLLSLRDWLELGQAIRDKCYVGPKYFIKWHTQEISIGENLKVKANGKIFKSGRYYLDETK